MDIKVTYEQDNNVNTVVCKQPPYPPRQIEVYLIEYIRSTATSFGVSSGKT